MGLIVLSILLIAFFQQLYLAQIAFPNEILYAIPKEQSLNKIDLEEQRLKAIVPEQQLQSAQSSNDKELQEIANEVISEQKLKIKRGKKRPTKKMLVKLLRSKIMKSKKLRSKLIKQARELPITIFKLLRMVIPKLIG